MSTQQSIDLAAELGELLQLRHMTFTCAESCTGGLIAAAVTEIAGSSAWFERGIVSYSNSAKIELLGVQSETLEQFGAVSGECVSEMVTGAVARAQASLGVAVSGIAGPGGGTAQKPVGTVWIGYKLTDQPTEAEAHLFAGSRYEVRQATLLEALRGTISRLKKPSS